MNLNEGKKKLTKRNNGRGHPYVTMEKGEFISPCKACSFVQKSMKAIPVYAQGCAVESGLLHPKAKMDVILWSYH